MGRYGSDDERIHIGLEDRATGSERICGGTSRRRNDQTIGFVAGNELRVHEQLEVVQPGNGALAYDDVVQCVVGCNYVSVAHHGTAQHGAALHHVFALGDCLQCGVEIGQRQFGEEAERSEVDAEDQGSGFGNRARR